ncbi:hypothetical protein [Cellulomonas citrea]|uniref:hypothetical protein n=1 Tax=Cellulomonas citrea TaxID=1909423 RepID=UPI00135AC782|nr:hypothetical protein [Cellulomonas citrea]
MTPHRTPHRTLLGAVVALGMLGAALIVAPTPAVGADLRGFDPGNIISDTVFYDTTTMNADTVQAFLSSAGAACSQGSDGSPCLKNYRESTAGRGATSRCAAYAAGSNESAAVIISKVAQACGINPQVLIVTLQKEQGLVTTTNPSAGRYRAAMGYGCPDSAACNSLYYGFFNQVYSAASQFRNYALNPQQYSHRAGVANDILFSPNSGCGSSTVFIQNQATASLYNYTPYQPNAAALAAGYGTASGSGAGCASYGNRNFWNYFTDWFGPTTQRVPIGSIDTVGATWNSISVAGWALDPDTTSPIQVHVYLDGSAVLASTAGISRSDIAAAFNKGAEHGYSVSIPARAGAHTLCIYAIDSVAGGPNPSIGCRAVTVPSALTIGSIDTVTATSNTISVAGWALDPDTTSPIQVHVYVDGAARLGLIANNTRTDVGAAYGLGDQHGFAASLSSSPGIHDVCFYAIDANGGANPLLGCRTVGTAAAINHAPFGSIDSLTTAIGSISVAGWALDPDTTDPIQVHTYVDGSPVLGAVANVRRTDVGAAFGHGDDHGFSWTVSATGGVHTVCMYAIDSTLAGPNPQFACRTVTVPSAAPNTAPFGSIDSITGSVGAIDVAGWALDPDTTDPILVHVYVDGAAIQGVLADATRTDVGAAFGRGDQHGFYTSLPSAAGQHTVCVYAIDSTLKGPNPQLGCRSVTVG